MNNKDSSSYNEAFYSFSSILYNPNFPNDSVDDLGKIMNTLNTTDRDRKIAESKAKMWREISRTLFVTIAIILVVFLLYAY